MFTRGSREMSSRERKRSRETAPFVGSAGYLRTAISIQFKVEGIMLGSVSVNNIDLTIIYIRENEYLKVLKINAELV